MDREDPRDDGNSAQRLSLGCREPELRGRFLPCGSSVAAEVGILRLIPRRESILKHSGNSNFVMRKEGTDGEPFCGDVAVGGGGRPPERSGWRLPGPCPAIFSP